VRLVAFKGNLYVVLSDAHVASGQDAMVKQGLTVLRQHAAGRKIALCGEIGGSDETETGF